MKLVPCAGRVIVKRLKADEKTPGGIILPDAAKEKPVRGKIVAIGKGRMLDDGTYAKVELEEGTEAVFSRYDGNEIELDGEKFLILDQSSVLATIEG